MSTVGNIVNALGAMDPTDNSVLSQIMKKALANRGQGSVDDIKAKVSDTQHYFNAVNKVSADLVEVKSAINSDTVFGKLPDFVIGDNSETNESVDFDVINVNSERPVYKGILKIDFNRIKSTANWEDILQPNLEDSTQDTSSTHEAGKHISEQDVKEELQYSSDLTEAQERVISIDIGDNKIDVDRDYAKVVNSISDAMRKLGANIESVLQNPDSITITMSAENIDVLNKVDISKADQVIDFQINNDNGSKSIAFVNDQSIDYSIVHQIVEIEDYSVLLNNIRELEKGGLKVFTQQLKGNKVFIAVQEPILKIEGNDLVVDDPDSAIGEAKHLTIKTIDRITHKSIEEIKIDTEETYNLIDIRNAIIRAGFEAEIIESKDKQFTITFNDKSKDIDIDKLHAIIGGQSKWRIDGSVSISNDNKIDIGPYKVQLEDSMAGSRQNINIDRSSESSDFVKYINNIHTKLSTLERNLGGFLSKPKPDERIEDVKRNSLDSDYRLKSISDQLKDIFARRGIDINSPNIGAYFRNGRMADVMTSHAVDVVTSNGGTVEFVPDHNMDIRDARNITIDVAWKQGVPGIEEIDGIDDYRVQLKDNTIKISKIGTLHLTGEVTKVNLLISKSVISELKDKIKQVDQDVSFMKSELIQKLELEHKEMVKKQDEFDSQKAWTKRTYDDLRGRMLQAAIREKTMENLMKSDNDNK